MPSSWMVLPVLTKRGPNRVLSSDAGKHHAGVAAIRCWDTVTGQARWFIPACSEIVAPTVHCVRFSPDGKRLATAANHDPAVRLWDSAQLHFPPMAELWPRPLKGQSSCRRFPAEGRAHRQ